jgi:hypothetical protein
MDIGHFAFCGWLSQDCNPPPAQPPIRTKEISRIFPVHLPKPSNGIFTKKCPLQFALDDGSTLFYSSTDLNPVIGPAWMHCIVQG